MSVSAKGIIQMLSTSAAPPTPRNHAVPHLIHFIWAGGQNPMRGDGIETVNAWMAENPACQIMLWVDSATFPGGIEALQETYQKLFTHAHVVKENEKISSSTSPTIILKDIAKYRKLKTYGEIINYEIEKFLPNYGASSDILRLLILLEYGGLYVDPDVRPGKNNLFQAGVFIPREKHILYVDHATQRKVGYNGYSEKELREFNLATVGNDTLISTPGNPLLAEMLHQICERYTDKFNYPFILRLTHGSELNKHMFTIHRTGPHVVQEALANLKLDLEQNFGLKILANEQQVVIKRVRDGELAITAPLPHAGSWLKLNATPCSPTKAYEILAMTVQFEAEHFKILRLEDHILSYAKATGKSPKVACQEVIDFLSLNSHLYTNAELGQSTFLFPEVRQFYRKIKVYYLDTLDTKLIINIIENECPVKKLLEHKAELDEDLNTYIDAYNNDKLENIKQLEGLNKEQILSALRTSVFDDKYNKTLEADIEQVKVGLAFVDRFYTHIDELACCEQALNKLLLLEKLHDIVQVYLQFGSYGEEYLHEELKRLQETEAKIRQSLGFLGVSLLFTEQTTSTITQPNL